ncbi:unnamed protein product, partial [Mycena citricolor]
MAIVARPQADYHAVYSACPPWQLRRVKLENATDQAGRGRRVCCAINTSEDGAKSTPLGSIPYTLQRVRSFNDWMLRTRQSKSSKSNNPGHPRSDILHQSISVRSSSSTRFGIIVKCLV